MPNKFPLLPLLLISSFFISVFTLQPAFADTTLTCSISSESIFPNQTFQLGISINPQALPNFTTKIHLNFPTDLLSFDSFEFASGWMSIGQAGYDFVDQENGIIIKTAGFPGGFSDLTPFGTLHFTSLKSGTGNVTISPDSFSLDSGNNNTLAEFLPSTFITIQNPAPEISSPDSSPSSDISAITPISETETPEPETPSRPRRIITEVQTTPIGLGMGGPEQLFDINLEIDQSLISDIKDLVSRLIFVSFGQVPTPVDLTFTIQDDSGKTIHTAKDGVIVETEVVFTKTFPDLSLAPGKYKLIATTLYNIDIEDKFAQSFQIKVPVLFSFDAFVITYLTVSIFLFFLLFLIIRKKYRQDHSTFY